MMITVRLIFLIIAILTLQSCKGQVIRSAQDQYVDYTPHIEEYKPTKEPESSRYEELEREIQYIEPTTSYNVNDNYASPNPYEEDFPITTDSRIRNYIYSPGSVYLLVVHFGFQSHIEFSKGEEVESIILGDTFGWKITPLDNRLFINPLEKNINTNMTILTNKKRSYQFDLISKELDQGYEKDLVYAVRFYYPKKRSYR